MLLWLLQMYRHTRYLMSSGVVFSDDENINHNVKLTSSPCYLSVDNGVQ